MAQFTSNEAIANTPHSPRLNNSVSQGSEKSNTFDKKSKKPGEKSAKSSPAALAAERARVNSITEQISDMSKLSEPARRAVRATVRQALAYGFSDAEALSCARVAARSGMNIVFDGAKSAVGDANIQGNTIYINSSAPKERLQSRLLLHEVGHALLRSKDSKDLVAEAFGHIAPERSQEIAKRYINFYKKQGVSAEQYMPIVNEEITMAYIEDVLGDANAWEYILSEEPSMSQKILSFFRKAARDYSADEKLSAEARKLLRTYKKLFADLSAQNQGNNALELSRQDERTKKAVTRTNDENVQVTDNSPRITSGMSDDERYEVLKDKDITISAKTDRTKLEGVMSKLDITESDLDLSKYGDKKRLFKKLGEEFGVFRQYNNPDTSVKFSFSKGGMAESVSKQRKGYMRLAKLLTCIDGVIENAVGIESHNRNDEGYKVDTSLKNVYVLASAFVDGENIIPVKLEVKEFSDKENTLYVAIALESIKKNEIIKQEVATNGVARQYSPSFTISIADFLCKINPSDESFYKYIPKRLLEASKTEQYISPPSNAEALIRTPEARSSMDTVPTDSITDPAENVNRNPEISSDERFALDADTYTYETLTKKKDLSVVTFPTELPMTDDGNVDTNAVVARGRLNARKQKNPNNTDTETYVRVDDIGLDVLLSKKGMVHGIARSQETAFAVMKIGDVLKNSVAVNELNGSVKRKTEMSYVLLGACRDNENLYVVRSVVSKLENDVTEIDVYQLSAVKGKKTETPTSALGGAAVTEQSSLISSESLTVSIADFLEYVKTIPLANEIFSEDVAAKLGKTMRFAIKDGDVSQNVEKTKNA